MSLSGQVVPVGRHFTGNEPLHHDSVFPCWVAGSSWKHARDDHDRTRKTRIFSQARSNDAELKTGSEVKGEVLKVH